MTYLAVPLFGIAFFLAVIAWALHAEDERVGLVLFAAAISFTLCGLWVMP